MNFNSHRKEIIDRIINGDIDDIYSFLKSFDYLEKYKIEKEPLIEEFNEGEKSKEYKIPNPNSDFENKKAKAILNHTNPNFTENDFIKVKADYYLDTPGSNVKYNGKEYSFSFLDEGVIIAQNYSNILEFVSLWQQLQKEGLIFEIEKEIEEKDIGIFYEKKLTKETSYYKELISGRDKAIASSSYERYEKIKSYDNYEDLKQYGVAKEYYWPDNSSKGDGAVTKSLLPYYDTYLVFNYEHLVTCQEFINKKIVATPALEEYAKNQYQTEDEKKNKLTFRGTWVAIGISFLMAVFSIFSTFHVDPSDKNLKEIQSQLDVISGEVDQINEKQLHQIQSELEEIMQSINDVELQNKLKEIIDLLNDI